MSDPHIGEVSWERQAGAVEKVRIRLLRAAQALDSAGVLYAVIGGNAVAAWVSRIDEAAVRNTRDVDILIRRDDLERAKSALEGAGFVYRHVRKIDMFLDGPEAKARDAVHILFADEKVRDDDDEPAAGVHDAEQTAEYRLIGLAPLVQMKLTSFRDKDRMHLRDLIDVGLVDETWLDRLPDSLRIKLRKLLDTPDG